MGTLTVSSILDRKWDEGSEIDGQISGRERWEEWEFEPPSAGHLPPSPGPTRGRAGSGVALGLSAALPSVFPSMPH